MPTRAEIPRPNQSYHEDDSWTDALPICRQTGVGFSTNQIYREDGYRQEEHPFEDRCFHCHWDDTTYLYGVFDGHEGVQAAKFALQRMTAEIILFDQLSGKTTDEEIREVLRQAFIAVEKGYMDSIDDRLAERASLQLQYEIDGLTSYEAYQKFPHLVDKLNALNCELSAGTTAVVALVCHGRLFVANVGDSRALLCRTDADGVLRVVQLSADHDLSNEDETLRLRQLGLDVALVRCQGSRLTRCLGDYLVKGGYKENEALAPATAEPVIAEPEVHGGIQLDESCRFLMLMSAGLYKALEEATSTQQVNKELAQMAVEQFREQSTLNSVAQAVVDKIVRLHHDHYVNGSHGSAGVRGKRDDITLLVRNFNFPMPKAPSMTVVQFNPVVSSSRPAWTAITETTTTEMTSTTTETDSMERSEDDTETCSSSDLGPIRREPPDRNRRVDPYVDFSEYYRNVERAHAEGTLPDDIDVWS